MSDHPPTKSGMPPEAEMLAWLLLAGINVLGCGLLAWALYQWLSTRG